MSLAEIIAEIGAEPQVYRGPLDTRSVPVLLEELAAAGVTLRVEEGKLKVTAATGWPDGAREELQRRKEELKAWLVYRASEQDTTDHRRR